jgi:uncharacterized membrane protein
MSRWVKPALFGLAMAALGHLLAVASVPRAIMGVAMGAIAETAGGWNTWTHAPRVTPQSQRIVRSSPDLAYSSCAIDVSVAPVRIEVAPWGDYVSVALYDAQTDNVFTLNDAQMGAGGARLMIVGGRTPLIAPDGFTVVRLPSDRGLVLVRRLAPTPEAFARADAARQSDVCRAFDLPPMH